MNLYWKAFLALSAGIAMFLCFVILPLIVFAAVYFSPHDNQWIIRFMLAWMYTFIFTAVLMTWGMLTASSSDKDERFVLLKLAVCDGVEMMLYWNPIGWLVLLWRRFVTRHHRSHG